LKESIYNPEFVRKLFNEMSTSYERMNYLSSFGFSLRWRNQFVRKLPATQEPIRVIDLMTGMGEIWSMMRKRWPEATLHALDFSDGMLKHADRKNKKHFNGLVQLLNQDVLRNNLPDESYDQVTSCFGLKTFDAEQIAGLAAETRRILKPGGQFAFIEVSSPPNSILRFFYGFYLGRIVPVLGWLMLGNPREYRMLWRYTRKFVNARNTKSIFEKEGLQVTYDSYFGGCATGIHGTKPLT
jgi:ubiquinone/menaquinone biosynthesis methyltransferase